MKSMCDDCPLTEMCRYSVPTKSFGASKFNKKMNYRVVLGVISCGIKEEVVEYKNAYSEWKNHIGYKNE